jgi:hypothetical protein
MNVWFLIFGLAVWLLMVIDFVSHLSDDTTDEDWRH